MCKPYVVSGDAYLLLKQWASNKDFQLPTPEFFYRLREEFTVFMQQMFGAFDFVSEQELVQGLSELVEQVGLQAVSLDRAYYLSLPRLEIARLVSSNGEDVGLGRRPGTPPLLVQLRTLRRQGITEVALVDDVVFSGSLLVRIVDVLADMGIRTPIVCTGVGVEEGVCRLQARGVEVRSVRRYEEVIDEICERDFFPGVPLSGRLLACSDNVGAPYILPFGNPGKWASIPTEWHRPFSRFCLQHSIELFEAIEEATGRPVYMGDIDRKVIHLPTEGRLVDALYNVL